MTEPSVQDQIELERGPAEESMVQPDPYEGHYPDQQVPLTTEVVAPESSTMTKEVSPINPEVRDLKMGLLRSFIRMTKDGSMEPEEAEEYIARVRGNGFISDQDVVTLKAELVTS